MFCFLSYLLLKLLKYIDGRKYKILKSDGVPYKGKESCYFVFVKTGVRPGPFSLGGWWI